MKLNVKKCSFLLPEVVLLGNLPNAKKIGPDRTKVAAMLTFPKLTCQKKLKGALVMFQFYKKYIPNYSTIVIPLNKLLLQTAMFRWTTIEQEEFECLKDKLKNAPFMQYPNDTGVFTLETDASSKSIFFILYQSRPNEDDGIVACGGRSLQRAEFNYTVTELKMLSVVDALNK